MNLKPQILFSYVLCRSGFGISTLSCRIFLCGTMNNQTQDDFTCLHIAISNHSSSSHQPVDPDSFFQASRSEKRPCGDQAYVPVNVIKPEVYALIAAWEACQSDPMESEEAAESTLHAHSESMYEPSRCIPTSAPPKRFYLSFWRSVTRRMLEHTRKSILINRLESQRLDTI